MVGLRSGLMDGVSGQIVNLDGGANGEKYPATNDDFWNPDQLSRVKAAMATHNRLRASDQADVYTIFSDTTKTDFEYTLDVNYKIIASAQTGGDGTAQRGLYRFERAGRSRPLPPALSIHPAEVLKYASRPGRGDRLHCMAACLIYPCRQGDLRQLPAICRGHFFRRYRELSHKL